MSDYKLLAGETIRKQADAILKLADYLTGDFSAAVRAILACKGRVAVSGVGKSAIIARKIAATLSSTGTPSFYIHAADAVHGDLGAICPEDVFIILSKSGSSPEINFLLPLAKKACDKTIAICGNPDSRLAKGVDYFLNSHVEKESCPNNLAPTSSTTAQLVLGDALADALQHARGFSGRDFARYHPGGALGRRLSLTCCDLAENGQKPAVGPEAGVREVIMEISSKRLGVTAVTDETGAVVGVITDGDIRRTLEKNESVLELRAKDIMTVNPKTMETGELAYSAMELMQKLDINQLIITKDGFYFGVIHIHDLLNEGFGS